MMIKEKPTILVVDGAPRILTLMHVALADFYKVLIAEDGGNALDILEKDNHQEIKIVITGIVMSVINGLKLIEIIRKKYAHIPVIAMTGSGEKEAALAIRAGAETVFCKPFAIKKLHEKISMLLEQKLQKSPSFFSCCPQKRTALRCPSVHEGSIPRLF